MGGFEVCCARALQTPRYSLRLVCLRRVCFLWTVWAGCDSSRAKRTGKYGDHMLKFLLVNSSLADTVSSKVGHRSYRIWHDTLLLQLRSQKELSIQNKLQMDKESKTQGEIPSCHNSWPFVFDFWSCNDPCTASWKGHDTITCCKTLRTHIAKLVNEWWCSSEGQDSASERRRTDMLHDQVLAAWLYEREVGQ